MSATLSGEGEGSNGSDAASSGLSNVSARRRKPQTSTILPIPLAAEPVLPVADQDSSPDAIRNGNIGSDSDTPRSTNPSLIADKHHSMREMLCNAIFGKWKALVFGQVMSLALAGTAAIQSELYLDCHLSAPTFCMFSFYFPLSVVCIARLVWKERRRASTRHQYPTLPIPERAAPSMQRMGNLDNNNGTTDSLNSIQNHSAGNKAVMPKIRAKFEKRNQLLSRWSQYPPSADIPDHDQFYVGGNVVDRPNDDVAASFSLCGLIPIKCSPRVYAAIAAVDVYANYTTILAFKYTTIGNVSLFDALAVPSAIFVSRFVFERRYTKTHLLGVMVCSVGIIINVLQDYSEDKHLKEVGHDEESSQEKLIEEDYPQKFKGDVLAIMGGALFGIDNTMQEVTVKDVTLTEYLGCMTLFASIISLIQALVLERQEVKEFFQSSSETCAEGEGWILFSLFSVGGMLNYSGIGAFLQISDAAFLNLSLLTSDAWTVSFGVLKQGIVPPSSFYFALIITISGVFIYEMAPTPVMGDQVGEIELAESESVSNEREEIQPSQARNGMIAPS